MEVTTEEDHPERVFPGLHDDPSQYDKYLEVTLIKLEQAAAPKQLPVEASVAD